MGPRDATKQSTIFRAQAELRHLYHQGSRAFSDRDFFWQDIVFQQFHWAWLLTILSLHNDRGLNGLNHQIRNRVYSFFTLQQRKKSATTHTRAAASVNQHQPRQGAVLCYYPASFHPRLSRHFLSVFLFFFFFFIPASPLFPMLTFFHHQIDVFLACSCHAFIS